MCQGQIPRFRRQHKSNNRRFGQRPRTGSMADDQVALKGAQIFARHRGRAQRAKPCIYSVDDAARIDSALNGSSVGCHEFAIRRTQNQFSTALGYELPVRKGPRLSKM